MSAVYVQFGPFFDHEGHLCEHIQLRTYEPGTYTPHITWASADKVHVSPHPVMSDASGIVGAYIDGAYRLTVSSDTGVALLDCEHVVSFFPHFDSV